MSNITLKVNGRTHTVDVEPSTPLLYILRNDLGLQGPRFGCGLGQCGACTVIINGAAVRSCVTPVPPSRGEITTLEGLAEDGTLHPVQQAWIDEQVPQCGFCQNGQIMTAKVLLDKNPESDRRADSRGDGRRAVPLHDVLPRPGRHQARGEGDAWLARKGRRRMSSDRQDTSATRLPQGFGHARRRRRRRGGSPSVCAPIRALRAAQAAAGPYPDPDFRQLDSWIVIHEDNTATFYVGKTDCGQGTGTAFRQMMSDELDIAYDKTSLRHGQHRRHRRPGRIGRIGCDPDRRLADAARRRRGAARAARDGLDAASACRSISSPSATGVITVKADPSKRVTYGELIGGKRFNVALTGNNVDATTGVAKVKPVQELKIVGQSPQRYDIPAKVDGSLKWAVDVKLPGMVHARNVKPPVAGATLVSIDESSVRRPSRLHQGRQQGQLRRGRLRARGAGDQRGQAAQGQLAEAGDARRSRRRKISTRTCAARRRPRARRPTVVGDPDAALAGAAKVVEAEYDVPFQGHTAFASGARAWPIRRTAR